MHLVGCFIRSPPTTVAQNYTFISVSLIESCICYWPHQNLQ